MLFIYRGNSVINMLITFLMLRRDESTREDNRADGERGELVSPVYRIDDTRGSDIALCLQYLGYGAEESALYLHGAVLTLAAGYTLKHDGHVRIDIF